MNIYIYIHMDMIHCTYLLYILLVTVLFLFHLPGIGSMAVVTRVDALQQLWARSRPKDGGFGGIPMGKHGKTIGK